MTGKLVVQIETKVSLNLITVHLDYCEACSEAPISSLFKAARKIARIDE